MTKPTLLPPTIRLPPVAASGLPGRGLFVNDCLCVRLPGLPPGCDVGACLAGCQGSLTVSDGRLEIESTAGHHSLGGRFLAVASRRLVRNLGERVNRRGVFRATIQRK